MDVQQKLDEIVTSVDSARSMPMSASCVVNRAELLAMLEEVRQSLPGSLAQAEELLGGREQMVAEAQAEAQRIIETGHAERGSLVSGTEVVRQAQAEADQLLAQARQEAAEIRAEADDYVDSKLANFEVVLSKTIGSVERGRDKLLGSGPGSEEWNEEYAEDAPERSTDPQELRQRADTYVDARLGSVSAVLAKTLEAVGRGRGKLLGHRPSDDLGAHMAAQDAAAGTQGAHTSDADFMADLAAMGQTGLETPMAPMAAPMAAPVAAPMEADPAAHLVPEQPGYQPVAGADPYAAQVQQDPYYAQQDAYAYQQQQQQYAYYGQQQDPYYVQHQQQHQFEQEQLQHQQMQQQDAYGQPQMQQQQQQLDETSFFDTGMIDLEQVRQYEAQYDARYGQGNGQGYGQGG